MRFHFLSSQAEAQEARQLLIDRYGQSDPKNAMSPSVLVVMGNCWIVWSRRVRQACLWLNRGTIGFLLNEYRLEG